MHKFLKPISTHFICLCCSNITSSHGHHISTSDGRRLTFIFWELRSYIRETAGFYLQCDVIWMEWQHFASFVHRVRKRLYPFIIFFFPRCPVCGEWCKLQWLLLDTPSFDWNPRRSRGHKMFKMVPTKQQKAFCAVEYAKTSAITVQRNLRRQFEVDPPDKNSIKRWHTQLMETGCLCKGKSTGRYLCVAYAKTKAPDVVFAYSTAQNAFCCLVGAILNILCPRERWVFQSKLGVSSNNQCNLHHSPHTGHLEKK